MFRILIIFILCLSFVSAEYYAGETYSSWVNGTLTSSQVSLYQDGNKVSVNPLIKNFIDDSFVYFDLPLVVGNYTLYIGSENVSFIVNSSDSSLRVKPAIILLENNKGSFSLNLKCIVGICNVTLSSDGVVARKSNVLVEDTKDVYFDYNVSNDSEISLSYNNHTFIIPVVYLKEEVVYVLNETVEEVIVNETIVKENALVFLVSVSNQNLKLNLGDSKSGDLKVQNVLDVDLNNLNYTLTGERNRVISFNATHIDTLMADEIYSNRLLVNGTAIGVYNGSIILSNSEYSVELPIAVEVVGEEEVIVENINNTNYEDIIFQGTIPEETSGNGVYILGGIIIVILLALILLIIFKLHEKKEKKFNEYIEMTKKR